MPVLAHEDVVVHKLFHPDGTDVHSVTLSAGDSIDEADVPEYVLEAIKSGEVTSLSIATKAQAQKAAEAAAAADVPEEVVEVDGSNVTTGEKPRKSTKPAAE